MPNISNIPKDKRNQKAREFINTNYPVWIDPCAERDLMKVLVEQELIAEDEFVLSSSTQNISSKLQGIEGVFATGYREGLYTDKDLFFMTLDQAKLFCNTVGVKISLDENEVDLIL